MNGVYYKEAISSKTANQIEQFLINHPQEYVDYTIWHEAQDLVQRAWDEVIKSVENYRNDFDALVGRYSEYFKTHSKINIELELKINEFNVKLGELQNHYIRNDSIWNSIDGLLGKRIESKNM